MLTVILSEPFWGTSDYLGVTFPQFRGHRITRQLSSLRTQPERNTRWSSAVAADYRTPRCIQRYPAWFRLGWRGADGGPAHA